MVDSLGSRQITNTDGKIDELHRSPDGRYIAYLKIVEFVESPGLWEEGEEVPKEPVHHLVIQKFRITGNSSRNSTSQRYFYSS